MSCVAIDLALTLLAREGPTRYFNAQIFIAEAKTLVSLVNMLHPRSHFISWQSNWYRLN